MNVLKILTSPLFPQNWFGLKVWTHPICYLYTLRLIEIETIPVDDILTSSFHHIFLSVLDSLGMVVNLEVEGDIAAWPLLLDPSFSKLICSFWAFLLSLCALLCYVVTCNKDSGNSLSCVYCEDRPGHVRTHACFFLWVSYWSRSLFFFNHNWRCKILELTNLF